jgi:hypothetical protein
MMARESRRSRALGKFAPAAITTAGVNPGGNHTRELGPDTAFSPTLGTEPHSRWPACSTVAYVVDLCPHLRMPPQH